jgi:hypothetical protein
LLEAVRGIVCRDEGEGVMAEKINVGNIPPEILPYLEEISERLQTGHASVMVGAGFSKNVEIGNDTKKFPSWKELGDIFYDKLNGCDSGKKDYLDPLKLAGEVEAAFGRSVLNNIIRSSIPDKAFQPSELHEKLLNLPWTDIFTTNYDTLLERAAENILRFRYETIVNKEDLIWSTRPRIVKLHGSFPSERPFIITEEDYRSYPNKQAPFVNTVQQSLLENTLCLMGFSGSDPNFLNWIGWIRDNLGTENSPKMYLIGILSLSIGQKKVLENRNIVPIDTSFFSHDANHYESLSQFLDFLHKNIHDEKQWDWPKENPVHFNIGSENINKETKHTIKIWQETRNDYPDWLIMPYARRELFWLYTSDFSFIYNIKQIERPNDITILYEFNWRAERVFHPVLLDWAEAYRYVVDSYNPFPDKLDIPGSTDPEKNNNFDWETIRDYWIELQFALLAFYRQENMDSDWNLLIERIKKIEDKYSPEQNAKYHYERCLKKVFSLDMLETKEEIDLWAGNSSLPYWETKKAGLLSEIGYLDEAQAILETSLKDVRSKLYLNPVKNDYSTVSQEASILQLLDYVQKSIRFSVRHTFNNDKKHEEYRRRWKEIAEYECDPWRELDHFESVLKVKMLPYKNIEMTYDFEIGEQTMTKKWGNDDYTIKSYSFLKYMEYTGIPFRLPGITFGQDAAGNALERIADYSPEWALVTLVRSGEEKNIDRLFSRKAMVKISQRYADELSNSFLDILRKSKDEIRKGNSFSNRTFGVNLATILPQVLSRLCVKNSYAAKVKILSFVQEVYSSDKRDNYAEISKLTQGLIKSFSVYEQQQLFDRFLEFPVIPDNIRHKYPDPFLYIDIEDVEISDNLQIDCESIVKQLNADFNSKNTANPQISADIRKKYITRLVVLWRYGLLDDGQKKTFANLLWEKRKPNGFPINTNYEDFAFMWLPYPENINVHELFRQYVNQTEIVFDYGAGISMTGGYNQFLRDLFGTCNTKISYQRDTEGISILIGKLIKWWNRDKEQLKKNDAYKDIVDEYKSRFANMINIFIYVIAPNIEKVDENFSENIANLLHELPDYNIDNLAARASFIKLFPESEDILISDIENALLSKSKNQFYDALDAIIVLVRQGNTRINNAVLLMSQHIKFRSKTRMNKSMGIFCAITKMHLMYLNDTIIENLNIGLSYLLGETIISDEDAIADIHQKIQCRMSGIRLLLSLKDYYAKNNFETPAYMKVWEETCLDKDEFSEVRNSWLNYI